MRYNRYNKKNVEYYRRTTVLFALVHAMKNREIMFQRRSNTDHVFRGFFINYIDFLKKIFDYINFYRSDYNIYISNALYKQIPVFSWDLRKRSIEHGEWFETEAQNSIYAYDMLLDFDQKKKVNKKKYDSFKGGKDIKIWKTGIINYYTFDYEKMYKEVIKFKGILDKEKLKYFIVPSGNNFQIVLPHNIFNFKMNITRNETKDSANYKILCFTKAIKDKFKLDFLDIRGCGVYNKVRKCPYSLVKDKVVFPLEARHFPFEYNDVHETAYKIHGDLGYRGIPYFNDFSNAENKSNWINFVKKYKLNKAKSI